MDKLSLQIKIVCLVSILSGVLSSVIPGGKMKSAYLSLCGVVLISSMIIPLKDYNMKNFSFPSYNERKTSETLELEQRTAEVMIYEKVVSDALKSNLEKRGLTADITAKGEMREDEIRITDITLKGVFDSRQKQEITLMLEGGFPDAVISFEEGENE